MYMCIFYFQLNHVLHQPTPDSRCFTTAFDCERAFCELQAKTQNYRFAQGTNSAHRKVDLGWSDELQKFEQHNKKAIDVDWVGGGLVRVRTQREDEGQARIAVAYP